MSKNNYSVFIETLNAAKKEVAPIDKSNIIRQVENEPERPPQNLHKEYHDDYSRHRDRHVDEDKDNENGVSQPESQGRP